MHPCMKRRILIYGAGLALLGSCHMMIQSTKTPIATRYMASEPVQLLDGDVTVREFWREQEYWLDSRARTDECVIEIVINEPGHYMVETANHTRYKQTPKTTGRFEIKGSSGSTLRTPLPEISDIVTLERLDGEGRCEQAINTSLATPYDQKNYK